ncbi:TPA: diphthine synthase [Candidatus Woesearchaeota archaeon]|nr:diphthine synthase [Candidatus Woesearchaeota archaeon]
MTLYLVGIGLNDEKDITVKGLEAIRGCDAVYLENYTSIMACGIAQLEKFYGKKVIVADRKIIEHGDGIISAAATKNVALLVIGDPWGATTHIDIMMRCRAKNIPFTVINNASIITAIGITGLQVYKFGKTTSVPYPDKNFRPETSYEVINQNRMLGLHTLLLLDIRQDLGKFMTVSEAIDVLLEIESRKRQQVFTQDTFCVGCARVGSDRFVIKAASAKELKNYDFGKQPHCLIVPGELHFVEEDALKQWK